RDHGAGRVSVRRDPRARRVADRAPVEPLFPWGLRTYVMGIVNVTPDSFSGDGTVDPEAAVARGVFLAANGADVLDVGGESTRPGARPVDPDEERRRVLPVIHGLRRRLDIPISIDTYQASTAAAAIGAGPTVVHGG